jgi:hypothetical protein
MAKTRKLPDEEPRKRSRLFWICVLVLLEALLWTILAVIGVSETIATIVALVGGAAFVIAFRDRIWGEDWRAELERTRARRPR